MIVINLLFLFLLKLIWIFKIKDIQSLVHRAFRLRVLDISDSVLITDQSIISIRQHSRLLAHLSASRCYLLTPSALM